jgi:MoxR-like ATPase
MGLLLLVSPPGYGKTTLMEYVAQRLGLAFVKVNGPALGHDVTSVDPAEAPNATARQEIDKVNLALEMGSNVMLYLDDIQHTSPELLQKFISLCDAQRKVEGVWKGRTRTYDLRGKKFCIVMAGNPYTESGEQFRIPDMLANRADVYNLGDVLAGKADAFALSYLENALTSNPTLAPLATRDLADVHKLVRMARGEPVPASELSHGYPAVELAEIQTVLRHLLRVQTTLLAVNQEYIRSAAQADAYRTEPPFKLQGSYRNMNKVAEKVVADMRGRLTPEMATRWKEMKTEFVRQRRMGGGDDDPVTRLVGTLGGLGAELASIRDGIKDALGNGHGVGQLAPELRALRDVVAAAAMRASADAAAKDPEDWLGPRFEALTRALAEMRQPVSIEVMNQPPPGVQELLEQQILLVEKAIMPVVQAVARDRGDGQALAAQMMQIIELLQDVDARLRAPRA